MDSDQAKVYVVPGPYKEADSRPLHSRQQYHTPNFTFNPNNKFRRDQTPRSYPTTSVNSNEAAKQAESEVTALWSTRQVPNMSRPRPAQLTDTNLHGFSYCIPEQPTALPAWDSATMTLSSSHEVMPQTYAIVQDFYQPSEASESRPSSMYMNQGYSQLSENWSNKACGDALELQQFDSESNIGQAYTTDECVPILDLRYNSGMDNDHLSLENPYNSRRMSGSSFTMSTSGGLSDMTSYDEFSATLSEAPSFTSDYPPPSNRTSLMSSTQLSPVASPRMTPQNRSELVRTQSRGRASPSPRPSMRSAPYSIDNRSKRWSTGSYASGPRRPSPFVYHSTPEGFVQPQRMSSRHSSPTLPNTHLPLNMANLQSQQNPYLMPHSNPAYHRNSMILPSNAYHEPRHFETPPPLFSHGLFRMLQSNADPHSMHSHYTDLSDPPDLYASLNDEQIPPPPEDMNPSDPDLVPHEQELRFDGDLYTPRWVRGHGNKREGWCGICKPGRWLVLKNSAFWYDKSFTHGISAATGNPFQEPQETRRMDGNPDVWEGLCGSCNEWVALVSSKKKGTTWFRHAYKCHTHPKIKDAPKRRRESSSTRALAASTMAKPQTEVPKVEAPRTPQMTPRRVTSDTTAPAPARTIATPLPNMANMI
ncbi:hypothetical protein V491_05548 [Pseudogymnoascus sp. VKM F-3775]|nr:hypothetical protein V491_05548 [Pseudogymnoascus sp. VKM F-3775]